MKIKTKQTLPSRLTPLASLAAQRLWLGAQSLRRNPASNHVQVQSISGLNEVTEGHHEVEGKILSLSLYKSSGVAQNGGERKGLEIARQLRGYMVRGWWDHQMEEQKSQASDAHQYGT